MKQKSKQQPKQQPKPRKNNNRKRVIKRKRKIRKRQRDKNAPRSITNFTVIPQQTFKRHHICIDNEELLAMVKQIDPEKVQKTGKKKDKNGKRIKVFKVYGDFKPKDWHDLWQTYFDFGVDSKKPLERKKPKRTGAAVIKFDNFIRTDGVSISFTMERTKMIMLKSDEQRKLELQEALRNCEQVYSFDVGLKLSVGGIRYDCSDNSETNYRLPSTKFHFETGCYKRKKKMENMTKVIDEKMRLHRESLAEQPGPRSKDFVAYADHILMHFNEAIEAYCQYNYALQSLLKYMETNRYCSKLAKEMVNGKKTFVFVGDCFLPGNSPAKGYLRTNIRMLFDKLKQMRNCTVFFVDEFRTTKLCSRCFKVLAPAKRMGVVDMKHRFYTCKKCEPAQNLPPEYPAFPAVQISSQKAKRLLTVQRNMRPNVGVRQASKKRRYEVNLQVRDITWNRDVNAGRNIRYKGMY